MVNGSVHLWGENGKPSLISAESVALVWFVKACGSEQTKALVKGLEVVFSNNTDLSPDGKLPVLILDDGMKVTGYVNIVLYLERNRHTAKHEENKSNEGSLAIVSKEDRLLEYAVVELY